MTYFLPVPLDLMVSLTSTISGIYHKIGISGNFSCQRLDWNIDGNPPLRVKSGPNYIVLYFRRHFTARYHLRLGTVQRQYAGDDILEYLQTDLSYFGPILVEKDAEVVTASPILGFSFLVIASILLAFVAADRDKPKPKD